MDPNLYQYRKPIDFSNPRLRMLARALAPAYVRMSGTWANTTFFDDSASPAAIPPRGYNGVLTARQWLAAIDFARSVDARIVTSMPVSDGARDAEGAWHPDQARKWLNFTRSH